MIVLLDNYDSFTWNIYQAITALGVQVAVHRNDALSVEQVLALSPRALVLSPGPGRPKDAGIQADLIRCAPETLPILGVCLGHQGLVEHHGGELEQDPQPMHGRSSLVFHEAEPLFRDMPNPFAAGRYHSLRARRDALPKELVLTGWTQDGIVMSVRHASLPRYGVQFHPESILSRHCEHIFARFLELAGESVAVR